MAEKFWQWLCLFAFRRWRQHWAAQKMPVGLPNNRDPEHPCEFYIPGKPRPEDWNKCRGDGHYLCNQCAYKKVDDEVDQ